MSKDKTGLTFTDGELAQLAFALSDRHEKVAELWDHAREFNPDSADHWRERYEQVGRLCRRVETARKRLARKEAA